MADIARLNVLIEAKADSLEKGLRGASSKLDKFGSRMQSLGTKLSIGVTAPVLAIGSAAVKAAADAEESENLFAVSLGRMAGSARRFSEEISDSLGLNAFAVRETIGQFNALFTTLGLGEGAAANMAQELTALSADLASFFNISQTEAVERLRSGLSGEAETLRRLNVFVNEATVSQIAYANGIARTGDKLTEAQKVQARYLAILEQTGLAQGDLERTQDSLTNRTRRLTNRLKGLTVQLGQELVPAATALVGLGLRVVESIRGMAQSFSRLSPRVQKAVLALVGIAAAAGPALLALGLIAKTFGAIAAAAAGTQAVLTGVAALFVAGGPLVAGVAAAAVGLGLLVAKVTESSRAAKRARIEFEEFKETLAGPVTIDTVRDFNVELSLAAVKLAGLQDQLANTSDPRAKLELRGEIAKATAEVDRLTDAVEKVGRIPIETEATISVKVDAKESELNRVLARIAEVEANIARLPAGRLRGSQESVLRRLETEASALGTELNSLDRDLATFRSSAGTVGDAAGGATPPVAGLAEALAGVRQQLAVLAGSADVFDLSELEVAEERVRILESGLVDLLELGLTPQSRAVQDMSARWREATASLDAFRQQAERVQAIDPNDLAGRLAPEKSGTLAQQALGGINAGALDEAGTIGDTVTKELRAAEAVGRSFEGGFRTLGSNLIDALANGMEDASDVLKGVFQSILGGLLNAATGGIGGAITGLFSATAPVEITGVASVSIVQPAPVEFTPGVNFVAPDPVDFTPQLNVTPPPLVPVTPQLALVAAPPLDVTPSFAVQQAAPIPVTPQFLMESPEERLRAQPSPAASAAPLQPVVMVDLSGVSMFPDPAAVSRTPGAQVFIREGILASREGGFNG